MHDDLMIGAIKELLHGGIDIFSDRRRVIGGFQDYFKENSDVEPHWRSFVNALETGELYPLLNTFPTIPDKLTLSHVSERVTKRIGSDGYEIIIWLLYAFELKNEVEIDILKQFESDVSLKKLKPNSPSEKEIKTPHENKPSSDSKIPTDSKIIETRKRVLHEIRFYKVWNDRIGAILPEFYSYKSSGDVLHSAFKLATCNRNNENFDDFCLAQYKLLGSIMLYLFHEAPENEQNVFMVIELLNSAINDDPNCSSDWERMLLLLEEVDSNHVALKAYDDFRILANKKEQDAITACRNIFKFWNSSSDIFGLIDFTAFSEEESNTLEGLFQDLSLALFLSFGHDLTVTDDIMQSLYGSLFVCCLNKMAENNADITNPSPVSLQHLVNNMEDTSVAGDYQNVELIMERALEFVDGFNVDDTDEDSEEASYQNDDDIERAKTTSTTPPNEDKDEDDDSLSSLSAFSEWGKRKAYSVFLNIWFVGFWGFVIAFLLNAVKILPGVTSIAERFGNNLWATWSASITPYAVITFILTIISTLLNPEYTIEELRKKKSNNTIGTEIGSLIFFGVLWAGAIALSLLTSGWLQIVGHIASAIGTCTFLIYFPINENSNRYHELNKKYGIEDIVGISTWRKVIGAILSIATILLFAASAIMVFKAEWTAEFLDNMFVKGLGLSVLIGVVANYMWGKKKNGFAKLTIFIMVLAVIGFASSYVFQGELQEFVTGNASGQSSSSSRYEVYPQMVNQDITNKKLIQLIERGEIPSNANALNIGANQVSDVSPLTKLTSIEALLLGNNQIADVSSLSVLKKLTRLDISGNPINQDLSSLSELTNLTSLSLGSGKIDDVTPLLKLNKLTYLGFMECQIDDLSPLNGMKNLKTLNLHGTYNENQIKALQIALPNCNVTYRGE